MCERERGYFRKIEFGLAEILFWLTNWFWYEIKFLWQNNEWVSFDCFHSKKRLFVTNKYPEKLNLFLENRLKGFDKHFDKPSEKIRRKKWFHLISRRVFHFHHNNNSTSIYIESERAAFKAVTVNATQNFIKARRKRKSMKSRQNAEKKRALKALMCHTFSHSLTILASKAVNRHSRTYREATHLRGDDAWWCKHNEENVFVLPSVLTVSHDNPQRSNPRNEMNKFIVRLFCALNWSKFLLFLLFSSCLHTHTHVKQVSSWGGKFPKLVLLRIFTQFFVFYSFFAVRNFLRGIFSTAFVFVVFFACTKLYFHIIIFIFARTRNFWNFLYPTFSTYSRARSLLRTWEFSFICLPPKTGK